MGKQFDLPHTREGGPEQPSGEPEQDTKIPIVDQRIDFYVPNDAPVEEIAKVIGWLKMLPGSYIECDLAYEGQPKGKHRLTLERVDAKRRNAG